MVSGAKVLIIDDEVATTEVFAKMLQMEGYDVSTAVDAASGLRAARATPFDAVLLDLVMPFIDGVDWLRQFRAIGSTTPVAIITGNLLIDDETVSELTHLGAIVRFKPVWAEDLVAITEMLIEGNRRAHADA